MDLSPDEVRARIEELVADPLLACDAEDERNSLRLVVASTFLGTNADKLAKFLGLNRDKFVRPRAKRLRDNHVWKDGSVYLDGETDLERVVGLILAMLCAEGQVQWVREEPEASPSP